MQMTALRTLSLASAPRFIEPVACFLGNALKLLVAPRRAWQRHLAASHRIARFDKFAKSYQGKRFPKAIAFDAELPFAQIRIGESAKALHVIGFPYNADVNELFTNVRDSLGCRPVNQSSS